MSGVVNVGGSERRGGECRTIHSTLFHSDIEQHEQLHKYIHAKNDEKVNSSLFFLRQLDSCFLSLREIPCTDCVACLEDGVATVLLLLLLLLPHLPIVSVENTGKLKLLSISFWFLVSGQHFPFFSCAVIKTNKAFDQARVSCRKINNAQKSNIVILRC